MPENLIKTFLLVGKLLILISLSKIVGVVSRRKILGSYEDAGGILMMLQLKNFK